MKKITFYKSMIGGKFEQAQGYYYKSQNGLEFALHGGNRSGCDWCATELTTGLACPILGARTLDKTAQQVEQMADKIAHFFKTVDCSKFTEQITKLKATA